jgi:hypothetical protein
VNAVEQTNPAFEGVGDVMTDRFEFAEFHALSTVTDFGWIFAPGHELPARHCLTYARAARQLLLDKAIATS